MAKDYSKRQSLILEKKLFDAARNTYQKSLDKARANGTNDDICRIKAEYNYFMACCIEYSLGFEMPSVDLLSDKYAILYELHKNGEDNMRSAYETKVQNGAKGGRPKSNTKIVESDDKTT